MDHQDPPRRVPAPRAGGQDPGGEAGGEVWYPVVPAPRAAPEVECLAPRVTAPAQRVTSTSTALVCVHGELDPSVPGLLRTWARVFGCAVRTVVDGVRSLLDVLVPAPASR